MGKITALEMQKKNAKRISVFIDGTYAFGVDAYVAGKHKLEVGKEVNEVALKKISQDEDLEKAKAYTVDYLLGKTTKEIENKLAQKGYDPEVTSEVMIFIEKYKLVDNADYAKRYANDASKFKKHGKMRIKQTLKQKGVEDEDISEALSRIDEKDEVEIAKRQLVNKLETYRRKAKSKYELRGKCYQFLMARGYGSSVIEKVMNQLLVGEEDDLW